MAWLSDFHFMRPLWLLCLFLPFFLSFRIWKSEQIQSSWAKVCDEHLLKFLLVKGTSKQRKRPYFLAVLISVLMIIALAGPTWQKTENPALKVNNPVILALNVSSDMWAKDVTPSRGERSKLVAHDLLETLKTSEIGLLVYSREPFVITPLTEDVTMVDNLLPIVSPQIMPENGDRLDRAINLAVERMRQAGYHGGNIVVLTSDVGERFDAALDAALDASQHGFTVNVIKMSETQNDKLQMIADKGQGVLLNYKENMNMLTQKINDTYAKEMKQSENLQAVWEDFGYYVFWLPALLMLYYFRRGVMLVLLLTMLAKPTFAGWWLNNNQEAMQLFEKADYTGAAQKFDDEAWRGAAAYKSGNYAQALQDFQSQNGLDALYNQGNALAKSGKIDEAIKKYEEVLAQDEHFEDARFNLEYLKKQQQNQQQNQQNQNQNQKEQQDKQQNSSAENQQNDEQNQQNDEQNQQNDEQNQQNGEQNQQNDEQNQQQDQQNGEQNAQNDRQENNQNQQNENAESGDNNSDAQNNGAQEQTKPEQDKAGEKEQPQQAPATMNDENGENEAQGAQAQVGDEPSAEEKEKIRAREQRFREIPEDKGGLLRAFIYKEYQKQRYKD